MNTSTLRHIKPLGPRVLVRIRKLEDRTGGGLYLPAGAKEEHDDALYGEVVEVARAEARDVGLTQEEKDEPSLGTNVSGVPLGAFVLVPKKAGMRIPWDDQLRLIDVREVLATVDEIEPEEVQ
jgi:co-chaperonin GroES (HSP10)